MDDFEKLINASDLIEWIMETYPDWCVGDVRSIVDHVKDLPSAQTEIIRCKDCKWWSNDDYRECLSPNYDGGYVTPAGFYCGWAERRTDE